MTLLTRFRDAIGIPELLITHGDFKGLGRYVRQYKRCKLLI